MAQSSLMPVPRMAWPQSWLSCLRKAVNSAGRLRLELAAIGAPLGDQVGVLRRGLLHRIGQLVDDRRWRAGRGKQADPGGGAVVGQSGLGKGRHLREVRVTALASDGQDLELAGLDIADRCRQRIEDHLHLAADQVAVGAAGVVGHEIDLDPGIGGKPLPCQMRIAADARGCGDHRARLLLQALDQLLGTALLHAGVGGQGGVEQADDADRGEIAVGLVGHLAVEVGHHRQGGGRPHHQGVAIGGSLGRSFHADHAGRARAVLHDHRAAQHLAQFGGDLAGVGIRSGAGGEWRNDPDRLAG